MLDSAIDARPNDGEPANQIPLCDHMALSEAINAVWDPLKTPLALAGGAIATRLWQRYLNRLAVFRWSVWYTQLAVAGATPEFGTVEVTWNGNPATNLQFCNIEFENESGRDFTDVEVKFRFNDGTRIYGQGALQQTAQTFPYTVEFQNRISAAFAPPPAASPPANEINQLLSRREYKIPVINRGGRFLMTFVVHAGSNAKPALEVYCDHPGVRLVHRAQRPMFLGVVETHAAWVGLVTGLAIWLAVGKGSDNVLLVSTLAFVMGAGVRAIGAGIIHLKRFIARTIG